MKISIHLVVEVWERGHHKEVWRSGQYQKEAGKKRQQQEEVLIELHQKKAWEKETWRT